MSGATIEEARTWAGFRTAHVARSTGTLVVVVDGFEQGIESPGLGACRWFTICEDHDRLVGHPTLAIAKFHSSAPEEWCEVCGGQEPMSLDDEPIGEDVLDALRAADLSTAGVVGDVKLDSPTDWIEDGR